MSDLSAYSECLAIQDAKKLLGFMEKNRRWTPWSDEGGSEIEVKLENVMANELANIALPEYCSSIDINTGTVIRSRSDPFDSLLITGNDWMPPEYGDGTHVSFCAFAEGIGEFIDITISKSSGMRHYSRPYNYCCEFNVQWARVNLRPDSEVFSSVQYKNPGPSEVESFLRDLWSRYSLPDEKSSGWLETRRFEGRELGYSFKIEHFDRIHGCVSDMIADLILKSPCDHYVQRAGADSGGAASFEGEVHNVTEVARDLLRRVAALNSYSTYEILYNYFGPRSWKDREKSRKKWKKAIHEELGTATLENGAVAKVSLAIEKEGYVLYLNFESDDDLIKFYHSKLFQKTKWHSGAE